MRLQSGRWRAESGFGSLRSSCARTYLHSPLSPFRSALPPFRSALTLIELLITITIITILAGTFLGVSNAAMESAREARTKTTINKIHSLLMEKWSEYETRRVDIRPDIRAHIYTMPPAIRGPMLADARLLATRELMKLEMPDRWSDVLLDAVPNNSPSNAAALDPIMLPARPAISSIYLRRFYAAANVQDDGEILRRNQGAECLFLTIMLATGDGEARSLFSDSDIGDTDEDGAPEFLDGWGQPIRFVRWPAGFVSPLQPVDPKTNLRDGELDHDPFDPFNRDSISGTEPPININDYPVPMRSAPSPLLSPIQSVRTRATPAPQFPAFRLVPLVYSYGPDGLADLVVDTGKVTQIDPYAPIYDAPEIGETGLQLASVRDANNDGDDNSLDNIHNHLQDNN